MINKLGGRSEDPDSKYSYKQFEKAADRAPGFVVFFQPYYLVDGEPYQSGSENPSTGVRDYTVDGYRFVPIQDRIKGPLKKFDWLLTPLLGQFGLKDNAVAASTGDDQDESEAKKVGDLFD